MNNDFKTPALLPPPDSSFKDKRYISTLRFLESTYPTSDIRLGLERITTLLDLLGRPQDSFLPIIVAGTNGKGSTCAYLESFLRAGGIRVGANLSPHLEEPTERIRIDGYDISPEKFASLVEKITGLIDEKWDDSPKPTYHELLTAMAVEHFRASEVDVGILEVGLGGRYDAANAIDAPLVVLTPIGFDHMDRLGHSLAKIAAEKAAVIRQDSVVVCAGQQTEALEVIRDTCERLSATLHMQLSRELEVFFEDGHFVAGMNIDKVRSESIPLGIGGLCQEINIPLAKNAALLTGDLLKPRDIDFHVDALRFKEGLVNARLPGRFECIATNPMIVLDGAHNEPGALNLSRTLAMIPDIEWTIILGMKSDKDANAFITKLKSQIERLIFCPIPGASCTEPEVLKEKAITTGIDEKTIEICPSPKDAIAVAIGTKVANTGILITGSLYLVGYLRKLFRGGFDEAPC